MAGTLPVWFLATAAGTLGAIWGSFVAALCSRWPKGESIMNGRSRCDHCGQTLAVRDLVPIISFSLLRGRCRHCQQLIGEDSICIELGAVIVGASPFLLLSVPEAATLAVFGWLLLPLAILDFRHLWLPNALVALLAVAGLTIAPLFEHPISFTDRLIGAAIGFAGLEVVRQAYRLVRRRDGMGAGDPKLLAAIGIWQGWHSLPFVLLMASVIGITWVLITRNASFENRSLLPLGTFLSLAAYIMGWIG